MLDLGPFRELGRVGAGAVEIELDILILGGGVMGLCLLNEVRRARPDIRALLLETGTLGGDQSSADAINANGWVVGTAWLRNGHRHAVLWTRR